ncbi:MAG: diguanylate cyclase [Gemmatimonadota bacterium]|nr:diguanylate cyclase [Gemmatimonadota bacterium]MDH5758733.1 diguanylate cyclase [Gemmatimonadota bacterium]
MTASLKPWERIIEQWLGVLRLDSIKNKIVGFALLATIVPAFSTAVLSYGQNKRALTEKLEGELATAGSQAAREIDLWVKESFLDIRVFASSFEVSENLERIPRGGMTSQVARSRLADYLAGVQALFDDYTELLVRDSQIRPVASSGGIIGEWEDLPPDWSDRLRQGETVLGDPYRDEARGGDVVTFAVPIEAPNSRFLGVLTATLSLDAVTNILERFAPGEAGQVSLITADGRVVARTKGGPEFVRGVESATLDQLTEAGDATTEYADLDGVPVVGILTQVPPMGWAVIAEIPRAEAFAQVEEMRASSLFLVSILLVGVGLVAYLLALLIVRPLARLTQAAGAVAGGDLSVDLPVTGRGEVAYLTEVFNEMVDRLRQGRQDLDLANATLRERNTELERLSSTDVLTGLFNRRHIMDEFEEEIRRATRHERPFAVLLCDVDHFKQYNDTHGHLAGDRVLSRVGEVIEDVLRGIDIGARYGGEEFMILLPESDLDGAVEAAERLRERIRTEEFPGGTVTVSIGAAVFPEHGDTSNKIISAADAALYRAKRAGRDRVVRATPHA